MDKHQVASLLTANHSEFVAYLRRLSDAEFCFAPTDKWSAAQQLDHIVKSVSPVNMAMGLPKFILGWKFGKANRPSKTYDELINKYNRKLLDGGKASARFVPATIGPEQKEKLIIRLIAVVNTLAKRTGAYPEEALDQYILPHPLLGKLTLREMLYFTAHHVSHHKALVEKGLQ